MFARELTASPEVMSSVKAEAKKEEEKHEEDDRRGMVSRWSYSSSDFEDGQMVDREVSPVPGFSTPEAGQEAEQVSVEEQHLVQEGGRQTPSAQKSRNSTTGGTTTSGPPTSSEENDETEQQRGEELSLPFNNLNAQLSNLQISLDSLVSLAVSVEAAVGEVHDAMITLCDRAREAFVNAGQFMEEVERVEGQLGKVRRQLKGKGKEIVGSGEREKPEDDEDKGKTREDTLLGIGMQFLNKDNSTSEVGTQREQRKVQEQECGEQEEKKQGDRKETPCGNITMFVAEGRSEPTTERTTERTGTGRGGVGLMYGLST
ncbi:unnamed protein product [Sordaria macrospora k-hell]|uniref:WGS project CABT00000000 data, contig 2.60 n=1 Tax=Sordaria macrospora (strain ATCC MYA-333 / DSM 997 / K(L3346) / K-hell) TaxID=771870 RepID=F7WAC6_SORMK|nr:uncharacterized protein SMAC_08604 [Sordaria macrospora k-hell]CCC14161.1 unnamed protein product [Sordaria macrospora k-hell]